MSKFPGRVFQQVKEDPRAGLSLIEVSVSISVLTIVCLGVLASISTSARAFRESDEFHESQLLVQEVLEEIQTAPFDTLLSFDGQFVNSDDGEYRADISVDYVTLNLVRVHVSCTRIGTAALESEAVRLIADPS